MTIDWTVAETVEDTGKYVFNIYKSQGYDGPYALVESNIDEFEYVYANSERVDTSVNMYFKVETKNRFTGETLLSPIVGAVFILPRDEYAESIIYQNDYFLDYIINRPQVYLLTKKRTGTRCTTCWNDELGERTKSSCTVCYDTGYLGGYSKKLIKMAFGTPAYVNKFDISEIRDIPSNAVGAWTKNYPLVQPNDVIVDENNRRFRVIQSQPTTKDGTVFLHQIVQLQLIPPNNIIYSYSVL